MPPQTEEFSRESVNALVCPALNILRAIELELNGCDCIYKPKIRHATDNLLKLMTLAKRGETNG